MNHQPEIIVAQVGLPIGLAATAKQGEQ